MAIANAVVVIERWEREGYVEQERKKKVFTKRLILNSVCVCVRCKRPIKSRVLFWSWKMGWCWRIVQISCAMTWFEYCLLEEEMYPVQLLRVSNTRNRTSVYSCSPPFSRFKMDGWVGEKPREPAEHKQKIVMHRIILHFNFWLLYFALPCFCILTKLIKPLLKTLKSPWQKMTYLPSLPSWLRWDISWRGKHLSFFQTHPHTQTKNT